jgi:PncC family amidohydrolase
MNQMDESDKAGQPMGRIGPKEDKDLTNAEKIIFGLVDKGLTLSTAESVTAGGFGMAVTRVPGSSKVYKGGVVTYTRETKKLLLGLPDQLLDTGLVSPAVTLAMAEKALEIFQTDYAVAVTGNAGPTTDEGGGSVGRIYWAVVSKHGKTVMQDFDLFGNRDAVRCKAVTEGLRVLRNTIEHDMLRINAEGES